MFFRRHKVTLAFDNSEVFHRKFHTTKQAKLFFDIWHPLIMANNGVINYRYKCRGTHLGR